MSKQLTIDLNGQTKTLEFGKFYFLKFYGEATGGDPLNLSEILVKPEKEFDLVCALVYAGLKTEYKVNKIPVDFTKEDVQDWIGEKETSEITEFINRYSALTKSEGEPVPALNGQAVGHS